MIDETMLEAEEKMDKALDVAREDMASIRTGRATPNAFARLTVDYYGTPTPIPQLACQDVEGAEARRGLRGDEDEGGRAAHDPASDRGRHGGRCRGRRRRWNRCRPLAVGRRGARASVELQEPGGPLLGVEPAPGVVRHERLEGEHAGGRAEGAVEPGGHALPGLGEAVVSDEGLHPGVGGGHVRHHVLLGEGGARGASGVHGHRGQAQRRVLDHAAGHLEGAEPVKAGEPGVRASVVGEDLGDVQRRAHPGGGGRHLGVGVEVASAQPRGIVADGAVDAHPALHGGELLVAAAADRAGDVAEEQDVRLGRERAVDARERRVVRPERDVDARGAARTLLVEAQHAGVAAVHHQVVEVDDRAVGVLEQHRIVGQPHGQLGPGPAQQAQHRPGRGGGSEDDHPVGPEVPDGGQVGLQGAGQGVVRAEAVSVVESARGEDLVAGRAERARQRLRNVRLEDRVEEDDPHVSPSRRGRR